MKSHNGHRFIGPSDEQPDSWTRDSFDRTCPTCNGDGSDKCLRCVGKGWVHSTELTDDEYANAEEARRESMQSQRAEAARDREADPIGWNE